jgi:hypothetical protein
MPEEILFRPLPLSLQAAKDMTIRQINSALKRAEANGNANEQIRYMAARKFRTSDTFHSMVQRDQMKHSVMRPLSVPDDATLQVIANIIEDSPRELAMEKAKGVSDKAILDALDTEGVQTPQKYNLKHHHTMASSLKTHQLLMTELADRGIE